MELQQYIPTLELYPRHPDIIFREIQAVIEEYCHFINDTTGDNHSTYIAYYGFFDYYVSVSRPDNVIEVEAQDESCRMYFYTAGELKMFFMSANLGKDVYDEF